MKRRVVEILRENQLTYMRGGKEVCTCIEEKDGIGYVTRPEVPLTLEIEEGWEDLGKRMLIKEDGEIRGGFVRPKGKALGMTLCDVMLVSGNRVFPDIEKRIEEMKRRIYLGILLSVCKHYIKTDNKIQICVEWLGDFCYVRGWLIVD